MLAAEFFNQGLCHNNTPSFNSIKFQPIEAQSTHPLPNTLVKKNGYIDFFTRPSILIFIYIFSILKWAG
jgi:hypothetical protein